MLLYIMWHNLICYFFTKNKIGLKIKSKIVNLFTKYLLQGMSCFSIIDVYTFFNEGAFMSITNITTLPTIAMRGIVMFPSITMHFDVGREKSISAIKQAMKNDQLIFLVAQKDYTVEEPTKDDLYKVGVIARIVQLLNSNNNGLRIMVEGVCKASIVDIHSFAPFMECTVKPLTDSRTTKVSPEEEEAMFRAVTDSFENYCDLVPKMPNEIIQSVLSQKTAKGLFDKTVQNIFLPVEDKQALLEEKSLFKRLQMLVEILQHETNVLSWEQDIYAQVKEQMDKNQRDYFLREQMRVISEELGEGESPKDELSEYTEKIENFKNMSHDIKEKLLKECQHLYRTPPQSQEGQIIRTYIETCIELPWDTYSKERADIKSAERILNRDHYGMQKVKERILELIAVRKLAPDIKGQILCLAGPPGVGKTSIAKSVAAALNRKYVRISLGGVRDEAEIRGHRKTYLGSMPGRIINAMKIAGTKNPVILLDEIDKMSNDYKGDPSSAMLEVLDSEQNVAFRDHYLEVPFDLSEVLFITTANDVSAIPRPLFDRMEIIEMDSYTREEKLNIAKNHLIKKQLKRHGITSKQLKFTKDAIYALIDGYTKEAGVRSLEREISHICRKFAKLLVDGKAVSATITDKNLSEYMGVVRYLNDEIRKNDEIGVVTGLAWTSVGGEVMEIETAVLKGSGKIKITGQLGDVMKESAEIAVSYVRSIYENYGINPDFYKENDLHIHAPEGAVPKDGPSAGVTMVTAIVSALSGIPVRKDVAMTGEVTLTGRVLPIGGLKEKSMAAYKNGIKTVFIPKGNKKDLEEVDKIVKENINFVPVSYVSEVLDGALTHRYTPNNKPHNIPNLKTKQSNKSISIQ